MDFTPDYAFPVDASNARPELFMVPFCNCLFNTNHAVFKYMARHKDIYLKDYPFIEELEKYDENHQFAIEASFSYWSFFGYLREGVDTKYTYDDFMDKDCEAYCNIRVDWDPVHDALSTNMLFGIIHLLNLGIIRFLYIYDEVIRYDSEGGKLLYSVLAKYFDQDMIMLLSSPGYDVYTGIVEKSFFISPDLDTLYSIGQSEKGFDYETEHLVPRGILYNYVDETKPLFHNVQYWDMKYEEFFKQQEKDHKLAWEFYTLKPAVGRTTIYGQEIS